MRIAAAALALLLLGACATKDADKPAAPSLVPPPDMTVAPAPDARIDELQTAMTELLERIDVLNARIAKLESGAAPALPPAGPAAAPVPKSQPTTPPSPPAAPLPRHHPHAPP